MNKLLWSNFGKSAHVQLTKNRREIPTTAFKYSNVFANMAAPMENLQTFVNTGILVNLPLYTWDFSPVGIVEGFDN